MSKLLGQHIFKDGEATKPKAPKKKKKQRESDDEESLTEEEEEEGLSEACCPVQGVGRASRRRRFTLSKIFWAHIKANNLQSDPSNKRIIVWTIN